MDRNEIRLRRGHVEEKRRGKEVRRQTVGGHFKGGRIKRKKKAKKRKRKRKRRGSKGTMS